MHPTIPCPHCHVLQLIVDDPDHPTGEACCPNCGAPLPRRPRVTPKPFTVLCIDDDPLVLHFYLSYLEAHGYRTLTATEGLLGIDLAHRERPDVILLDVMLRGLSGFDICRKLRADPTLGDIPIILLTVWDNANVALTGREAGAILTLRKPADPETILTAIEHVLGKGADPPQG